MKFEKYFLLNWKKVLVIIAAWFLAVILHNMTYAFFMYFLKIELEEPVFFMLAIIVIPLYFIISIVYTIIDKLQKK